MRTHHRWMVGLLALAALATLSACGAGEPGQLEVACLPQAEVFVDDVSHGTTPVAIDLPAGSHSVRLVRDLFESFETTVDVGSAATTRVDAALVASVPTDTDVIRLLAKVSDIEFEEYEDPPRHRGRSKEVVARLVWPQDDVRIDGLATLCIEAGLEYMGDGFVEFRQGRKILYRAPFSPDYEVSVLAIPDEVREAVGTNDTVTWGITFDDRRKGILTKFKVVKKKQVDRKLAKLEKSRHFQRQPEVTQQLLRAQVLHNYSLYTESLVEHLMVHQRFPESVLPFEGVVKALRRMDNGDETMLWRETAGFVLGSGRGRRGAGASPIRKPGTRVEDPQTPARPDPAGAGDRPGGLVPGGTPNPSARLALWNPASPLGPGDEVPTGVSERPELESPVRPESTEPVEPDVPVPAEDENTAALVQRAEALTNDWVRARDQAHDARQRAGETRRQADHAGERAGEAAADHERARQALEEAERQHAQNPSEESRATIERRREEVDESRSLQLDAEREAEAAAERARNAEEQAADLQGQASRLEEAAQIARREAEQAGVTLPEVPRRGEEAILRPLLQVAGDFAEVAAEARREYLALREAADRTGDPDLQERAREALARAEKLKEEADAARRAYRDAGGEEHLDESGGGGAAPNDETMKRVLQERVNEAKAAVEAASERVEEARLLSAENPGNADYEQAAEEALAEFEAARHTLERHTEQYRHITGAQPE